MFINNEKIFPFFIVFSLFSLILLSLYIKTKRFTRELIKKLILLLRMVRHDINNDYQLIYGYAQLGKYQKIIEYIINNKNYNFISNLMKIKDYYLLDCLLDIYFFAKQKRTNISLEILEEFDKIKINKIIADNMKKQIKKIINEANSDDEKQILITIGERHIKINKIN